MSQRRICLDPGHGGGDNGASGNGILEDAWNLQFLERVGHHLRARGAEVVMTRKTDDHVALATRASIAVRSKCDTFMSCHCNSAGSALADGVECFYAPVGGHQAGSKALAERLTAACHKAGGLDNRGVKLDSQSQHPSLTVLRKSAPIMPAVLLELGFVSNASDSTKMKDARWREKLAEAIAEVLC